MEMEITIYDLYTSLFSLFKILFRFKALLWGSIIL